VQEMSLFNTVFGFSQEAGLLLDMLALDPDNIPRFRDCFYDTERHLIVIHTRTGGGNREYYQDEIDLLAAHPLYVLDSDDGYDSTYANFYFNVPEKHSEVLKKYFEGHETVTPKEKWEVLFKAMDKKAEERKQNETNSTDEVPDSRA
jgi:hypothetical protein